MTDQRMPIGIDMAFWQGFRLGLASMLAAVMIVASILMVVA